MLSQINLKSLPFSILGFSAQSGTGKTTLLKKLIPELKKRGFRLGLIKHTHHDVEFDNKGITRKIFKSGINVIATSSSLSMAEWHNNDSDDALYSGIKSYCNLPIDVLLIEGFKQAEFTKIEVHRKSISSPLLYTTDKHIIALATDDIDNNVNLSIPVLDLNNIIEVADWVSNYIQNIKLAE